MKKIIMGVLAAGVACAVFATDARVETMGRMDNFFRDETSIHKNAANMGLYDKIMYGSYGFVDQSTGFDRISPKLPYFGGMLSFGQTEGSLQKFAVGATFNRVDSALNYVAHNIDQLGLRYDRKRYQKVSGGDLSISGTQRSGNEISYLGSSSNSGTPPFDPSHQGNEIDLVGKIDLMFAYTLGNGTTVGLGGYLAFMDSSKTEKDGMENRFVRANVGVNTPIGDGVDLEVSVAVSALTLRGADLNNYVSVADNDIGTYIDFRMLADVPSINAVFVPHIGANIIQYYGGEESILDFNAGLGFNLNIDRGFFWTGFEGLFKKYSFAALEEVGNDWVYGNKDIIGGKVGFGIERNVLTDWFVIRVGGGKLLAKESLAGGKRGSKWIENSDDDHVSLGMGINVEDRLKVDFTVSKNIPYTFTNLFSGEDPYIATRVSAVFAF